MARISKHDRALRIAEARRLAVEARRKIRMSGRYQHSARSDGREMLVRAEKRLEALVVKP